MNSKRNISVVLVAAMILGLASGATAILITRVEFEPIVPVTVGLENIDLFTLVMEDDPGQVIFEFHNENLVDSLVMNINFEDYGFYSIDNIRSIDGVLFEEDISFSAVTL